MKKRNKAFTLVELLGVIVLLGIVALIAIPAVTNITSKQKEKLYYDQINQLIKAAQNWKFDHETEVANLKESSNKADWYELDLSILQNGSSNVTYLDKEFKNPRTNTSFINTYVYITKKGKSYLYCVETSDCYVQNEHPKYQEYKEIASMICCNGPSFKDRINS